jgi:hypothetical protein
MYAKSSFGPLSRLAPPATLSREGRGKNPGQSQYISLQDYTLPQMQHLPSPLAGEGGWRSQSGEGEIMDCK